MKWMTWLYDESFWKALGALEKLEESCKLLELCENTGVTPELMRKVLVFMQGRGIDIQTKSDPVGDIWIDPPKESPKYSVEMGLSEWLAFQAIYPAFLGLPKESLWSKIQKNFEKFMKKYHEADLLESLSSLGPYVKSQLKETKGLDPNKSEIKLSDVFESEGDSDAFYQKNLQIVEMAIIRKQLLDIENKDGNKSELYPHRLVYLAQKLCLVGEEPMGPHMKYIDMNDVVKIKDLAKDYKAKFTSIELSNFIQGIRQLGDQEFRLILKVKKGHKLSGFDRRGHYFGNEYIVTNYQGEHIWAATVEESDSLFEWLVYMQDFVEILDPTDLKEKVEYRFAKSKKLAG